MRIFTLYTPIIILLSLLQTSLCGESNVSVEENSSVIQESSPKLAYVIPIRDQIGPPILDILRRGLKSAIQENADLVILDMDTPGGELGVTLEIMKEIIESIERFDGSVITYVNKEAISAGAYIAIATSEIAFSPLSQIGAAEAVSGGGGNIDESMKRKLNSYLKAKIRNYTGGFRYRAKVMAAMMDANESLIIEGKPLVTEDGSEIKKVGELLTLTGEEASMKYGVPPEPLLGIGIFKDVDDLLSQKWGAGNYRVSNMELNWAEESGLWLNRIAPILLGIGMVGLFIEFKTPGFGIFGALGIILLLVFFGSKYVAGLAGQEELLLFLLGVCLVAVEVFVAPGLILPGLIGVMMMIGGIFWAMVDVWPNQDSYTWEVGTFKAPIWELLQAFGIASGLGFVVSKILPNTPLWNRLVLSASVEGTVQGLAREDSVNELYKDVVGREGKCVSDLFPGGEIEVNGKRFEAKSKIGKINKGDKIKVLEFSDFELIVEKVNQ